MLDAISNGVFSPSEPARYRALVDDLLNTDRYFLLADFVDYCAAQTRVDAHYMQPALWNASVVRNIAGMGVFSADRTVSEYVARVWSASTLPANPVKTNQKSVAKAKRKHA